MADNLYLFSNIKILPYSQQYSNSFLDFKSSRSKYVLVSFLLLILLVPVSLPSFTYLYHLNPYLNKLIRLPLSSSLSSPAYHPTPTPSRRNQERLLSFHFFNKEIREKGVIKPTSQKEYLL